MKTLEYILENYKSDTLDGRDLNRLARFIPEEKLSQFGLELMDEFKGKHKPIQFTKRNVLTQLKNDLDFAFTKALNNRGISASFMFNVIMMWNWVLEEGLENWDEDDYAQYGLPLFKATAIKYGFDNPIGNDRGDESHYAESW